MRRNVFLLLVATLAGTILVPTAAEAKGSHLRFARDQYAPGDRAVGHADVETWKGSGQPEDGPFAVYLVRGTHPLHLGYLPGDALNVGELHVGRLLSSKPTSATYRVTVAFVVPRVPGGPYAVWVCRAKCGANKMFGDLVYGQIVVVRDRSADAHASPDLVAPVATGLNPDDGIPWLVVTLSSLAAAAGLGARSVWRRTMGRAGQPT